MLNLKELCRNTPMIPVIIIQDLDDAVPMAKALLDGGLSVLEITLRTPCALEAISRIVKACPEATVGAGTLKTPQDIDQSCEAGVHFGVSPGSPPALVHHALEKQFPLIPGCATASEVMVLSELGYEVLKFFPAETAGGASALKALSSPFPELSFCPTGGISLDNVQEYLALPNVITVGGSWVVPKLAIQNKDMLAISKITKKTVAYLKEGASEGRNAENN